VTLLSSPPIPLVIPKIRYRPLPAIIELVTVKDTVNPRMNYANKPKEIENVNAMLDFPDHDLSKEIYCINESTLARLA
jgi:hypothetical protein